MIMEEVKKKVIFCGDAKKQQKICLTPHDKNKKFVKEHFTS